jgi:ChrR Cupin-like domain
MTPAPRFAREQCGGGLDAGKHRRDFREGASQRRGERGIVLEGEIRIGRHRLKTGDYLYTPPGGIHAASSDGGCVFLVTLPKPVVEVVAPRTVGRLGDADGGVA